MSTVHDSPETNESTDTGTPWWWWPSAIAIGATIGVVGCRLF